MRREVRDGWLISQSPYRRWFSVGTNLVERYALTRPSAWPTTKGGQLGHRLRPSHTQACGHCRCQTYVGTINGRTGRRQREGVTKNWRACQRQREGVIKNGRTGIRHMLKHE